jgi:hypothetical protein
MREWSMAGYDDETLRADTWEAPELRPRINAARLWSGGLATAVVAALIGLVGVLVVRAVLRVAFSGAPEAGVFGDSGTVVLCVLAAASALAATGLAHLLLLGTPRPLAYLAWIIGLVTAIAVVLPFLSGRDLAVVLAQAAIHLVIGLAVGSLVTGTAAAASREARAFDAYR